MISSLPKFSAQFTPSLSRRLQNITGGGVLLLFTAAVIYYFMPWSYQQPGMMTLLSCLVCAGLTAVSFFYIARGFRAQYLHITPVSVILYNTSYPATDIAYIYQQKNGSVLLYITAAKRPWLERSLHIKNGWVRTILEATASFFVILLLIRPGENRIAVTFLLALGYFAVRRYVMFIKDNLLRGEEASPYFPVLISAPRISQKETLQKEITLFTNTNNIPLYKEI